MLSKWMGHASLEVTSIYANALGEEQHNIAARVLGLGGCRIMAESTAEMGERSIFPLIFVT